MKIILIVLFLCVFGKDEIVETLNGKVQGYQEDGVYTFKGVPFAEPPIHDLRWKPPVQKRSWAPQILDARKLKALCVQGIDFGIPKSEDCLYLSVWTPNVSNGSLPVIVNIHGGGFNEGISDGRSVNGHFIARNGNAVFVSMNYRLGAFGFAPFFEGNFGMMDQRMAIEWTVKNIKFFGGDPNKITLIGHSAGGNSVLYHLISKQTPQVFHKAIILGNPSTLYYRTKEENDILGDMIASKLKCKKDDGNCLRSKSTDDILKAQNEIVLIPFPPNLNQLKKFLTWMPYIDGIDITDQPINLVNKGEFKKVPIMIGNTKDEAISLIYLYLKSPVPQYQYRAGLFALVGDISFEVDKYYPSNSSDVRETLGDIISDFFFYCSSRHLARGFSKHVNTYLFSFNYAPKRDPDNGHPLCQNNQKSCHSAECTYFFNTLENFRGMWPQTPQEKDLSILMMRNVVDGDPTEWKNLVKYDISKEESFGFDLKSGILKDYKKKYCDFIDKIGY